MKTQYIPKLILKIKKKRLHISTAGAQVWSLASGQLRSHMMCSMAKKKKKRERERERNKRKKKKNTGENGIIGGRPQIMWERTRSRMLVNSWLKGWSVNEGDGSSSSLSFICPRLLQYLALGTFTFNCLNTSFLPPPSVNVSILQI